MPSWGNNDNAANAPYWAVNSTIVNATNVKNNAAGPTAANVALLFSNTTADVYTVNATIGLFGVSAAEAAADLNKGAHTGWVLRTTGSGGRANRVQEEVLVAMNTMNSDYEDTTYKDAVITISSQPSNGSAANGAGNTVTFTVATSVVPSGTSLTYYWQYNNGSVWANTATAGTFFTGNTSTTLTANAANTFLNTYKVRVIVNAAGATSVTSANATITIT